MSVFSIAIVGQQSQTVEVRGIAIKRIKIYYFSLRKNITEISILLLMLSYERQSSSFKFILTGDTIVDITEKSLYNYFSPRVSRDLFEFAANFSLYDIPGHVLIILVIICLYSRDGMLMKKQVRFGTLKYFLKI